MQHTIKERQNGLLRGVSAERAQGNQAVIFGRKFHIRAIIRNCDGEPQQFVD
jgi:hypothetical protein